MTPEFRHDPGLWGEVKRLVSMRFPSFYVGAREWKSRVEQGVGDIGRFPYVSQKSVSGIGYQMMVRNRCDRGLVDLYFERDMLDAMMACVAPGDIVFDIGAAIGTHTIPCAIKIGKSGMVYSFEPDGQFANGLGENLVLNNIENAKVLQIALWNSDTELVLHTNGRKGDIPQIGEIGQSISRYATHCPISAKSIESLVQNGQVKPPDILKIDVEGAGQTVLEGLGAYRPRDIFMEVHPLLGENRDGIVEFLRARGYQVVWEQPRGRELHIHFANSTSKTATLSSTPNLLTTLG